MFPDWETVSKSGNIPGLVNDLPLQDSLEGFNLFADDATESAHGPDVQSVQKKLEIKASNVNEWCTANRVQLIVWFSV